MAAANTCWFSSISMGITLLRSMTEVVIGFTLFKFLLQSRNHLPRIVFDQPFLLNTELINIYYTKAFLIHASKIGYFLIWIAITSIINIVTIIRLNYY